MNRIFIFLFCLALCSCKSGVQSKACLEKSEEFQQITSSAFKGCASTCLRTNVALGGKENTIDLIRSKCEDGCRQSLPFGEINKIKESINSLMNCQIDYKKSL